MLFYTIINKKINFFVEQILFILLLSCLYGNETLFCKTDGLLIARLIVFKI